MPVVVSDSEPGCAHKVTIPPFDILNQLRNHCVQANEQP